ncbi:unnamed protein product [Acanthoscelides obtectus]|uniref:Uncharacterized protein n=1 Tax=Acanthoscelides obtectus TaxID=200917 RepID=A0A9P0LTI0_ACAOB|nr:unnamed protein product [Acanthoscelides obtectus]CAK1627159.1 hypothetical protein AOBTE_LOCUS4349 [Acanthoscelides obtectus]
MTPVDEGHRRIDLQYLDETMYSLFDRTVEDVKRNETLTRVILTQNNYILDALAHEREYFKIRTVEDVKRNETLKRVILTQNNYILDALAHEREYFKIR